MAIFGILALVLLIYVVAYRSYGGMLARWFGLDASVVTPAHVVNDGEDYVPTSRGYLLAQHFSAIAAAGPIVGPITAAIAFGWLPALVWIVVGSIFIGAMHDFASLVGSVRNKAQSVATIVRDVMPGPAYGYFLAFVWLALVYVIVAFTDITAGAFTDDLPLEGGRVVSGGGVATASLLYLLVGVLLGVALRIGIRLGPAACVFVPLVGVAIWWGQEAPVVLPSWMGETRTAWNYVILAYCAVASVVPVWALLQPRGFLGGFFLYGVLGASLLGIVIGGFRGEGAITWPAWIGASSERVGELWPFLFITIACGACSGFHGLVCSGTTSKQLDKETDAHAVGYGGMLLEGVVAVLSVCCVMSLVPGDAASKMNPDKIYALGVSAFVETFGVRPELAVSFALLAFTTFVYDTLDVATRLCRYIFQELTGIRGRLGAVLGTVATLALPAWFMSVRMSDPKGAAIPAWKMFWSVFGTSNQLLASLTLLSLTLWIMKGKRPKLAWVTGVPMVFMMITTLWALGLAVARFVGRVAEGRGFDPAGAVSTVLLVVAVLLIVEAVKALRRGVPQPVR